MKFLVLATFIIISLNLISFAGANEHSEDVLTDEQPQSSESQGNGDEQSQPNDNVEISAKDSFIESLVGVDSMSLLVKDLLQTLEEQTEENKSQKILEIIQSQKNLYTQQSQKVFESNSKNFSDIMMNSGEITVGDIVILNSDIKLKHVPLIVSDTILLSVDDLANITSSQISNMKDNSNFALISNTVTTEVIMGQNIMFVNDKRVILPMQVFIFGETSYIPAVSLLEAFSIKSIPLDNNTLAISIGG